MSNPLLFTPEHRQTLERRSRRQHPDKIGLSENLRGPFQCFCSECVLADAIRAVLAEVERLEHEAEAAALQLATLDHAVAEARRLTAERDQARAEADRLRQERET